MLNITGSRVVDDPTYRYKLPRLVARTGGRRNGIRTVIVNMADISTALNRPPDLATKYFGVELGAQSRWKADAGKCTVNGAHASHAGSSSRVSPSIVTRTSAVVKPSGDTPGAIYETVQSDRVPPPDDGVSPYGNPDSTAAPDIF